VLERLARHPVTVCEIAACVSGRVGIEGSGFEGEVRVMINALLPSHPYLVGSTADSCYFGLFPRSEITG
jgi:hypothetical protein